MNIKDTKKRIKEKLKVIWHWIDPYKQSIFYFDMDWTDWAFVFIISIILFLNLKNVYLFFLIYNPLAMLYNERLRFLFCFLLLRYFWGLICWLLFPLVLPMSGIVTALRLQGGRYVLPFLLWWLCSGIATTAGDFLQFRGWPTIIGKCLLFSSVVVFVLAIWSAVHYLRHWYEYPICGDEI